MVTQPAAADWEALDPSQMVGLGEHVVYEIAVPITLRAKESSILPINKYTITGDKVLVYDPKESEVNVTRAVNIRNDTHIRNIYPMAYYVATVLAPGTISVLEGGRFVGQVAFTPMLPGDDQLVPYGLDSTLSVSRSLPPKQQFDVVEDVVIEYLAAFYLLFVFSQAKSRRNLAWV